MESTNNFARKNVRQFRNFNEEKDFLMNLPINEKRKYYRCGKNYKTVKDVQLWSKMTQTSGNKKDSNKSIPEGSIYKPLKNLNDKIAIFEGNIASLEIDAIVNAANKSLMGGGGVDAVIHNAAGPNLLEECKTLNGCGTGYAKVTYGYHLPAKHVIHTVGPMGENPLLLENCYKNSLYSAAEGKFKTVAFPCISTGVYGYPNEEAAHVVLQTLRTFLEANHSNFDLIILCLFMDMDKNIYKKILPIYFPQQ